jgi:hypothetical protein
MLARLSIIISSASWATVASLICLHVAGMRLLSANGLDIATTWLMGTGALTLILPLASGSDCTLINLISDGLRLGDADLDTLLVPTARRRWRANPAVGTVLAHTASLAWVLSLIFSIQLGAGVYHMPPEASAALLRLLMAGAVWPTVLAVSGRVEARRQAIFDIACETHRQIRGVAAPCETTLTLKQPFTLLKGGDGAPRRRRGQYRRAEPETGPSSAHGA